MGERIDLDTSTLDDGNPDLSAVVEGFKATGRVFRHDLGWVTTTQRGNTVTAKILTPGHGPATTRVGGEVFRLTREPARRGQLETIYLGAHSPYYKAIDAALDEAAGEFPAVEGVYSLPAMMDDPQGLIEAVPGFHCGRLYQGTRFGAEDADPACPHLFTLFSAFRSTMPYPPHYTNLLAYTAAMWARPEYDSYPLLVVDGLRRNVGKTKILETLGWLLTGRSAQLLSFTKSEEQLERLLAAFANKPGPVYLPFDNIKSRKGGVHAVRSQALCIGTTSRFVKLRAAHDRDAGRLEYPIFAFSMNRAIVEHDLHDRSMKVLLNGTPNAELAPFPPDYARKNTVAIRKECMHLLRGVNLNDNTLRKAAASPVRFYTWGNVMYQVAARLREIDPTLPPLDLSVDSYDTCDGFVRDLISLVEAKHTETGRWPSLKDVITDARGLRSSNTNQEFAQWLAETGQTSDKACAALLKQEVIIGLQPRKLWRQGKELLFSIGKDDIISYTLDGKDPAT